MRSHSRSTELGWQVLGLAAVLVFSFVALPMPIFVSKHDVAKIEAQLANDRCVHSLNDWHREYVFRGHETLWPDTDIVDFGFGDPNKADFDGTTQPAGVSRPWRPSWLFKGAFIIDHSPQRAVIGTYDRKTGKISDFRCGCSMATNISEDLPVCVSAKRDS